MQIINNSIYNGLGFDPLYNNAPSGMMPMNNQNMQQIQQLPQMQRRIDPKSLETPEITLDNGSGIAKKHLFTVSDDGGNTIKVEPKQSDNEKKSRKKKDLPKVTNENSEIVRVGKENNDIENAPTSYTYSETNNLLHETLGQIDAVNAELVKEFEEVKHSRTMKNKYMVLNNLSENIGSMISNRINTIKEINNCISKANEMDYKKMKDIKAAQASMTDDKYISDLYQAFMQNPQNRTQNLVMSNPVDPTMNSGIIRANVTPNDISNGMPIDTGYLNYLSNITPEQNMMRYEDNPDVKMCVVYDASNGSKFFQVMNTKTGEVIPNVPVYDQMFMEDTTLDLRTGIAKNINLNETYPIVQINNEITSQY